jgi:hypothetical protein
LTDKFPKSFPQRRLIEIPRSGDCEPRGAQCVGDETGIVGWRGEPGIDRCRSPARSVPLRDAAALAEQQND